MKRMKKTHWLRNTLLILLACGIVGLVLSAVLFFISKAVNKKTSKAVADE